MSRGNENVKFRKVQVFYGWVVVAALFLVTFILWAGFYSFGVFFKPLSREFGMMATTTSGIMTLSLLVSGLFSWPMGHLTDRYGPGAVLAACSVIAGAGYILMTRIYAIWQIYVCIGVVVGMAMSSAYAVPAATAGRWFIRRRGLALSLVFTALGIAQMAAPPLTAKLVVLGDWRFAYLVIGISVLTVGVCAAVFLRRSPEDVGLLPDGDVAGHGGGAQMPTLTGYSLAETLRMPAFWIFCPMWALMALPILLVIVHTVPYAISMNISTVVAATIFTVMGAANIAGRLVFGSMADRIGSRLSLLITLSIQTIALILFVFGRDLRLFYLAALLFGASYSGADVIFIGILAEFFGRKSLGTIVGVSSILWRVGAATGPILGGWVFDSTGSYSLAFLVAAAGIAACIGLTFVLFANKPGYGAIASNLQ
ncbi:MAG: MFS transporter [Desulfobacterales bacterium]|nr:MFS transporter [Desulfobacterales bacterium]